MAPPGYDRYRRQRSPLKTRRVLVDHVRRLWGRRVCDASVFARFVYISSRFEERHSKTPIVIFSVRGPNPTAVCIAEKTHIAKRPRDNGPGR